MLKLISTLEGAPSDYIENMALENHISPLIAAILYGRGIQSDESVQKFLHPNTTDFHDPMLLPDMPKAVMRIETALQQRQRICIYGDYDVDGICATALLYRYLSEQGADVCYHIPLRQGEGYGMHESAVRQLAEDGINLIITVDNGISAAAEIKLCYDLGMEVVVTDHHQCPARLPDCCAIVNPARGDSEYPFAHLCGTGVAFKLVQALSEGRGHEAYLPFAALATVADVVPLLDENRIIVSLGMGQIVKEVGLRALLTVAGAAEAPVNSETLAFRLAPRLNAAGRMGDATRGVELLLCKSPDLAMKIALDLNEENIRRQQEEQRIIKEAKLQIADYDLVEHKAILLYSSEWNPGVIGIVASRLAEEYYRPVILFHLDGGVLTGSGRSIPGIHLHQAIDACRQYCIRFGGHAQAAGLAVAQTDFPAFAKAFHEYLVNQYPTQCFIPCARYEMDVPLSGLSQSLARELLLLEPFGEGNPRPVFCSHNVALQSIQRIGNEGTHLRGKAVKNNLCIPLIAFGKGHMAEAFSENGKCFDLLYHIDINEFRGMRQMQLRLQDVKMVCNFGAEQMTQEQENKFFNAFFENFLYNDIRNVYLHPLPQEKLDGLLCTFLKENIQGTLVLCYTPQGAARCLQMLADNQLLEMVDQRFTVPGENDLGYNLLLFAPDAQKMHLRLKPYRRIICYDVSPEWNFFWRAIPFGKEMEAYCPSYCEDGKRMLSTLDIQRPWMEKSFRTFRCLLSKGPLSRHTLCTQALPGEPYGRVLLSLLVFIELGFILWDAQQDTLFLNTNQAPRSLMESIVYAAIQGGNMRP